MSAILCFLRRAPLLTTAVIASCSTVRLTPSASKYMTSNGTARTAQNDLDRAMSELAAAQSSADRVLQILSRFDKVNLEVTKALVPGSTEKTPVPDMLKSVQVVQSVDQGGNAVYSTDTREQRDAVAQRAVDLWWMGAFGRDTKTEIEPGVLAAFERVFPGKKTPAADSTEPAPLVANSHRLVFLRQDVAARALDVRQLRAVENGTWQYFVDGAVYFSIEPLVAIRPELKAVAIPSIAVNVRPWNVASKWGDEDDDTFGALSAVGLQLTLGGALNPSGGGENSVDGALGVGFSIPVASVGAFSFGAIWFADGSDSHGAPYISLTLGDFGKPTNTSAGKQ